MEAIIYNTLGTIGVGLLLTAYFLLQTGRIQSDNIIFSLVNLTGSSLILISLIHDFNLPSFMIEMAWAGISLFGLWRKWQGRSAPTMAHG